MELNSAFIGINLEGFSFSIIQQHPIFPSHLSQTEGEKLHVSITLEGHGPASSRPAQRGQEREALGTCPACSETNGDTSWPLAPDPGTLSGAGSLCQRGRQTVLVFLLVRVTGSGHRGGRSPWPPRPQPVRWPLFFQHQRRPSRVLGIKGDQGSDSKSPLPPGHTSEKMHVVTLDLGFVPLTAEVSPSSSRTQMG